MKLPLPRPVFPALEISETEDEAFTTLVDEFIDKLLVEEHEYRFTNAARVDETKWKYLRKSETITVYRERARRSSVSKPLSPTDDGMNDELGHKLIPPLLIAGKVPGSLDDLLYGFTTPTRECTLIKTSYVEDGLVDIEVLRAIKRPTLDEPFSHVSLKWFVLSPHSSVLKPRDYVYVDTIGARVLPSGERIGYRFSHSVTLKGAEPKDGFVRANFSICGIFRETPHHEVQLYGRAFFEPGGAIPRSIFAWVVSMQVTTVATQILNGQLKKLALALRCSDARTWHVALPVDEGKNQSNECGVCAKALHLLNKSRSKCVLCTRRLCRACRVRKQLSFLDADYSLQRRRFTFCGFCMRQAISLPATFAATEEFLSGQDDFYRAPESFSTESSSSIGSTTRRSSISS